jgi:hypothetical protein
MAADGFVERLEIEVVGCSGGPQGRVICSQKASGGALALKSEPGRPATLGRSAAGGVRLIVWCRDCRHQVEPDPAEQAQRW